MAYINLASAANSTQSSTSTSYLHDGGVSTVPPSLASNSSSLFGSVGGGKQWTNIGQSNSLSPSSTLTQQLLMKQQHLLNNQSSNSLNSSSHLDSILGLSMIPTLTSSSQTQMEKNVKNDLFLFF